MSKSLVRDFWQAVACGEAQYLPSRTKSGYAFEASERYRLEPEIVEFAEFHRWKDKDVLEIGTGIGADHQRFAEAGARLTGIDLTPHSVELVRRRFEVFGLSSNMRVADAEALPFPDSSFDLVYSWGVIHHTPNTAKAAREILRALRPGGEFRVMIYNRHSVIGLMLWLRYGYRCGFSLAECYSRYLESPGTKAYTPKQAAELFPEARDVRATSVLTHGDLLTSEAGQRHRGPLLKLAKAVWPRWLIKTFAPNAGLFLLVKGYKPL